MRNYKKYSGGGILIDQGIHMLDLMRYFSGEKFTKVNSYITTAYWNISVEDNAFILMQSENKVIAVCILAQPNGDINFYWKCVLKKEDINLDGILSGTRSYAPESLVIGRREFEDVHLQANQKKLYFFENDHSWNLEIKEFLNAINGKCEIKEGTLQDAYETLSLVEEVYKQNEI